MWALSRIAHSFPLFRQILGEPDEDSGSGIHIYHYALTDRSTVFIGEDGRRLRYVTHESIVATDERATKDGKGTEFRWEKKHARSFDQG
ncbi:MAG: hypothetical protein GY723_14740 [bacterium]|nr:hypothetical protein [bacterium]